MTELPFSLVPFPGEAPPPGLSVSGTLSRRRGLLSLRASLSAPPGLLSLPAPAPRPERRGRLWEDTCLELFLAEAAAEGYVELNLSPAGHWNAYRFDRYRSGMREEPSLAALPFSAERRGGTLAFSLELPLSPLFPGEPPVEAAVAAVARFRDGAVAHLAVAHAAPRPDFHRRDAFRLLLPAAP